MQTKSTMIFREKQKHIFDVIHKDKLIPLVTITKQGQEIDLVNALLEGGLHNVEITLRSSFGISAIAKIKQVVPSMIVIAGTVTTLKQAKEVIDAQADLIVTPGFSREIVDYAQEHNDPVLPGCSSPTDIMSAISLGLTYIKFFPSESIGGVEMIKTLSKPFNTIRFIPTGGISQHNINDYLKVDSVLACGGSWMIDKENQETENYTQITEKVKEEIQRIQ